MTQTAWTDQDTALPDDLPVALSKLRGRDDQSSENFEQLPIIRYDLKTSKGGRDYIAEYFAKRIGRHDFSPYIDKMLSADFACVLAQHLAALSAQEQKN